MLPHSDNNFRWQWPVSLCLSIWHRQFYENDKIDYRHVGTLIALHIVSREYQTGHIENIRLPMTYEAAPPLFYHIEHWTPAAWCRFLQHWSTFNNTSVTLILSQRGSHYHHQHQLHKLAIQQFYVNSATSKYSRFADEWQILFLSTYCNIAIAIKNYIIIKFYLATTSQNNFRFSASSPTDFSSGIWI